MRASIALVDLIVRQVRAAAGATLAQLVHRLRAGRAAVGEAPARRAGRAPGSACLHAGGRRLDWYWPAGERPQARRWRPDEQVRLLTPFDPIVWDRRRFEVFWGWAYRFEAYTPAPKRKLGYYALPLLWHDQVIGWGNCRLVKHGALQAAFGYVAGERAAIARLQARARGGDRSWRVPRAARRRLNSSSRRRCDAAYLGEGVDNCCIFMQRCAQLYAEPPNSPIRHDGACSGAPQHAREDHPRAASAGRPNWWSCCANRATSRPNPA